ncbi:MAG: alpha/beta hydrolase family protein [Pseudomarimonas sp.]
MNPQADTRVQVFSLNVGADRADATLYRAARPDAPCVLVFPALGTPARPYQRLALALQTRGIHALLLDWRGMASSSVRAKRGVDWSYLDLVDEEATAMIALARRELPSSELHGLGHSLGGQVALLHVARHPQNTLTSLMLVASASPHFRAYPFPYRLAVFGFAWVVAGMSTTLGVFRGDWLRFGGTQGATLMREWSRFNRSGRLSGLRDSAWDSESALAAVSIPLYVLTMRGDNFAPVTAARELAGKTPSAAVFEHLEHLPDGRPPGHFDWMKAPEPVADRVAAWLGMAAE